MMLRSSLTDFTSLAQRLMTTDQRLWELVKGSQAGIWAKEWNVEVERFLAEKKVKEYFESVWRVGGNVPTEVRSILVSHSTLFDIRSIDLTFEELDFRPISSHDSITNSHILKLNSARTV